MHSSSPAQAEVRSTTASGSTVYESARATDEYLQFHFGAPHEVLPYEDAPHSALDFLPRLARECAAPLGGGGGGGGGLRALDVGCAVGRASFELSRHFDEVVGVDFSHAFVEAAQRMATGEPLAYTSVVTADVVASREARLPPPAPAAGTGPKAQAQAEAEAEAGAAPLLPVRAERVRFAQGDACALDAGSAALGGRFDAILASNLLCRLPKPAAFLESVPELLRPGGVFVLASPYSWLAEYTERPEWLGGYVGGDGEPVDSFEAVTALVSPKLELLSRYEAPFLIREHARKFQWSSSDTSVWRLRE